MGFYNKVILMGNVTRIPDVRVLPTSNSKVARTGLACNRKYRVGNEQREEVMFIDVVCFGRLAEVMGEYVNKGNPLLIEGRLSYNTWEQDGVKRSKHEIVVDNFQMLSGRSREGAGDYSQNDHRQNDSMHKSSPENFAPAKDFDDSIDEDDIPF